MNETGLIKLDAFEQALIEAKTIPEVKNLRDQAATFKDWLNKRGANRLEKNAIAELQLRAERKIGGLLNLDYPWGGDRTSTTKSYLDLGISDYQSRWWRQLHSITEDSLDLYLTEINADEEDKLPLSTLGFIRWHLRKQKPEPSGNWLPLPERNFRTLVIDPPWPIQKLELDERTPEPNIEFDTKTIEQITSLDIPNLISNEGTHCYLWTTQKHIPTAFEILESWGLKYVFTMVWHKTTGSQPFNLPKYNCEFALFGRTNGLNFLETRGFFTCFNGLHREHSQKPKEFYELVARVSPPPRLDMFSREKHDGFEQYGNEVSKFNEC